jgi:hypothetical protein
MQEPCNTCPGAEKFIFATKQNCKCLVEEARSKAGAAVELAIEASSAKSEQLISFKQKMSDKKVAQLLARPTMHGRCWTRRLL